MAKKTKKNIEEVITTEEKVVTENPTTEAPVAVAEEVEVIADQPTGVTEDTEVTEAQEHGPATEQLEQEILANLGITLPEGITLKQLFPKGLPATALPTPTPEVDNVNTVTVNQLAKELGIQPKSLRSRLRKSGYKKGGNTWGWSPESPELAEIRTKFAKSE